MTASPLIKIKDKTLVLPPAYMGSIEYYAAMSAFKEVVINECQRYDKRKKSTHRCAIADTHGQLMLTVPIVKPENSYVATWQDIKISSHGAWWNVHLTALASAYGRTPFFEFYIDRFMPFFVKRADNNDSLVELNRNIDKTIRDILGIESVVKYAIDEDDNLLRMEDLDCIETVEYYQIRSSEYGFIPHLSILDLIFNKGPEAPLVLHKMTNPLIKYSNKKFYERN